MTRGVIGVNDTVKANILTRDSNEILTDMKDTARKTDYLKSGSTSSECGGRVIKVSGGSRSIWESRVVTAKEVNRANVVDREKGFNRDQRF